MDALKEGMLSMVRKLQRQFRHSQADQPRLQDQLLIGTKHTRQFQIDVLLNVALREEERVQMARAAAEHLQHVFGARSAMAQASFFHTPGPTMVHLHPAATKENGNSRRILFVYPVATFLSAPGGFCLCTSNGVGARRIFLYHTLSIFFVYHALIPTRMHTCMLAHSHAG